MPDQIRGIQGLFLAPPTRLAITPGSGLAPAAPVLSADSATEHSKGIRKGEPITTANSFRHTPAWLAPRLSYCERLELNFLCLKTRIFAIGLPLPYQKTPGENFVLLRNALSILQNGVPRTTGRVTLVGGKTTLRAGNSNHGDLERRAHTAKASAIVGQEINFNDLRIC